MSDRLKKLTKEFEGCRLKPYKCPAGKLTIGYGRNLDDVGISQAEADMMFERDFAKAEADVRDLCKEFDINVDDLIEQRFYVLTDMCFNIGKGGLKKFKKLFSALKKASAAPLETSGSLYDDAANAMLDSLWAKQVGNRATKLAALMRG